MYGLNIVYNKTSTRYNAVPNIKNTRYYMKNIDLLTGSADQELSFRNLVMNPMQLYNMMKLISNPYGPLKRDCAFKIITKIKVGTFSYSDLYVLFRWCFGINNIAFFFPACRTCSQGVNFQLYPLTVAHTPGGKSGKRTAGKQTRKKRKTKRKKSAVKSKKRVNGVKKAMKRGSSKKKR